MSRELTISVPTELPELLRFAAKYKDLSNPEVAKKAKLSYAAVLKIMKGCPARFSSIKKVAKAVGVKIEYTLE